MRLLARHTAPPSLSSPFPCILPAPFFFNAPLPPCCRKEFRLHKNADARFVQSFLAEWRHYAATLEAQQTLEVVGAPLDAHLMGVLSDEQKDQLNKLEAEARRMQ